MRSESLGLPVVPSFMPVHSFSLRSDRSCLLDLVLIEFVTSAVRQPEFPIYRQMLIT